MRERSSFNSKRRIRPDISDVDLESLASRVRYGGNPEHKRNPGDFGLTPPASPRPDKTLCEVAEIFSRKEAVEILRQGVRSGLISQKEKSKLPQNIWAVTNENCPVEAQLENCEQGTYHGYPMPENDPLRQVILEAWSRK